MTRVKIRLDELYPHFRIIVPGEDSEIDEFENYDEGMYEVDEAVLARWRSACAAFFETRKELRALYESDPRRKVRS